jgi:hypothetical protein
MDLMKHLLQSFSPEYSLKKKASLRLQAVHIKVLIKLSLN